MWKAVLMDAGAESFKYARCCSERRIALPRDWPQRQLPLDRNTVLENVK